jgi:Zn-finger protein
VPLLSKNVDVVEWVWNCLYPLDSNNVNSLNVSSTTLQVFACNECCLFLSSEMDDKLIELVCKCEELYHMSDKKYSDSVWKEILWVQIGEEF